MTKQNILASAQLRDRLRAENLEAANRVNYADEYAEENAEENAEDFAQRRPRKFGNGSGRIIGQFDLTARLLYTLVTDNSVVLPSALPAAAQTGLPVHMFGAADSKSGFKVGQQNVPYSNVWVFQKQIVVGNDDITAASDAVIVGRTKLGDLVLKFKYSTTHWGWVILSCQQTGYYSLLESTISDQFTINRVKYNVLSTSFLSQFNNAIFTESLGIFGKNTNDQFSPNAFIKTNDFQQYMVDISMDYKITKNWGMSVLINYDCPQFIMSFFVTGVNQLK